MEDKFAAFTLTLSDSDDDQTPHLLPGSPLAAAILRDFKLDLEEDTPPVELTSASKTPRPQIEEPLSPNALYLAARKYNKSLLKHFLDRGVAVIMRYEDSRTILHELVRLLTDKSKRSKTLTKQERKKRNKLYSSLTYILEHEKGKQLLEEKDVKQRTPLHEAVLNNYLKVAEILLGAGAYVSAEDIAGHTPLHYATLNHSTRMVTLLLLHGAHVNVGPTPSKTPLIRLFQQKPPRSKNYVNIFKMLLNAGATITTNSNQAFFHQVLDAKDISTLTILLKHGALKEFDSQSSGSSIIHHVLGLIEHVQAVKEWNDKYWGKKDQNTGEFVSSRYESSQKTVTEQLRALYKCLRLLIKYGAQGNFLTNQAATPLLRAIESKLFDLVKLLAKYYPQTTQIADSEGNLPLHLLIKEYSNLQKTSGNDDQKINVIYDAVNYLAAHTELKANKKGITPVQLAEELKLDVLLELFKEIF